MVQFTKKRIIVLLLILLVLAAAFLLLPRPKRISQSYESLMCSPDSFAEAEPVPVQFDGIYLDLMCSPDSFAEAESVTVQFDGIYLDFLLFQDRYYGTIHLMDYPREGKNTGGKFEPLTLSPISRDVVSGNLVYFKKMKLNHLGFIFWDRQSERFLILSEDYNILYPANTGAEAEALYWDLTQPE